MKPIIEVNHVWKEYHKGIDRRYKSLRDTLINIPHNIFGDQKEKFWALEDIDFKVEAGESIGIIGRNGAGKSTLLKILSRITPPTKGEIILRGRVASLLEVGTGFHPELTGRENVFFNGSILGMKHAEIKQKFDEIVFFSGVESFIDTPLKHYSSGMQMRLAFSVAAHLDAEILMIDEVLAVGDADFQEKCITKILSLKSNSNTTLLIVSHDLRSISRVCGKGLLLSNGQLIINDTLDTAISKYLSETKNDIVFNGPLSNAFILEKMQVNNEDALNIVVLNSNIDNEFCFSFKKLNYTNAFRITFSIYTENTRLYTQHDCEMQKYSGTKFISSFTIPRNLLRKGTYTLALGGHGPNDELDWFWNDSLIRIEISESYDHSIEFINKGIINVFSNAKRVHL